jgi:hypothetical protein
MMFFGLVSVATAFLNVPAAFGPAATSPYTQYMPAAEPQFGQQMSPVVVAAPAPQPAATSQVGALAALCGLGAVLGFGAAQYRAAFAVAGKRTAPVTAARTSAPVMQVEQYRQDVGTGYGGGVAPTRAVDPATILVQGGSLRTWSYRSPAVEQVQVVLSTEGRPLDADIELWHGPDNTPVKMRVYVENGQLRPFSAVVETPRGPNTIAIRNIGQIEFPIAATVLAENVDNPSNDCMASGTTIQGGALRTYPFDPSVDSVEVLLRTDGRPLNARIELLQGPNNNKQVIELYTEDGCDRPFFCILETPGSGNVVRLVNTSPVEFPMAASVVPHSINQAMSSGAVLGGDVVIGGDVGW